MIMLAVDVGTMLKSMKFRSKKIVNSSPENTVFHKYEKSCNAKIRYCKHDSIIVSEKRPVSLAKNIEYI